MTVAVLAYGDLPACSRRYCRQAILGLGVGGQRPRHLRPRPFLAWPQCSALEAEDSFWSQDWDSPHLQTLEEEGAADLPDLELMLSCRQICHNRPVDWPGEADLTERQAIDDTLHPGPPRLIHICLHLHIKDMVPTNWRREETGNTTGERSWRTERFNLPGREQCVAVREVLFHAAHTANMITVPQEDAPRGGTTSTTHTEVRHFTPLYVILNRWQRAMTASAPRMPRSALSTS